MDCRIAIEDGISQMKTPFPPWAEAELMIEEVIRMYKLVPEAHTGKRKAFCHIPAEFRVHMAEGFMEMVVLPKKLNIS